MFFLRMEISNFVGPFCPFFLKIVKESLGDLSFCRKGETIFELFCVFVKKVKYSWGSLVSFFKNYEEIFF